MIVFIHYGLDEVVIMNTECFVGVFMNCLKKKCCSSGHSANLDLSDEYGNLQGLSSMIDTKVVCKILEDRKKYILVNVQRKGKQVVVTPLLINWKPISIAEKGQSTK